MVEEKIFHDITSFYLENLPKQILDLFIPQVSVAVTKEALPSFAAQLDVPGAVRTRESNQAMAEVFTRLRSVVESHEYSFVRLGSKSPKDVEALYGTLKVSTAKDALLMFAVSKRIRADVNWNFLYGYPPVFFVRPWMDLSPWREFRCFIRNRELEGISQYFCRNRAEFPEIAHEARSIAKAVTRFIREKVIPMAEHDTFACDVYYTTAAPLIVDYNPLTGRTGLCFFDASLPPPERPEVRFRHNGGIVALPLPQENP